MKQIWIKVSEYFSTLFAICVITTGISSFKPELPNSKVFLFDFDESRENRKELYKQGVEIGCQGFVISDEAFLSFLTDFYEIHDECIQVFPNKHVVVYQTSRESRANEWISLPDSIEGN